nr:unnamed protein product [Callosobruchus chinensis]
MENTKSKASNNGETGDLENAVNKAKGPPSAAVMKKEKRQSRFNISRNQELEMLPPLRESLGVVGIWCKGHSLYVIKLFYQQQIIQIFRLRSVFD